MSALPLGGAAAFAAGAGVTTFFAPCAFPLLPGYVGYYVTERDSDIAVVAAAAAAAVGAITTLGAVAGVVLAAGQPVKAALPAVEPLIGLGLVVVGVLTAAGRGPRITVVLPERPASVVGFGVFGGVYALAAAGCVVPVFIGVIGQAVEHPLPGAVTVLGVYATGVAAPLVGVTLLAGAGVDAWRELGAYTESIERAAGVVMVAAGVGQIVVGLGQVSAVGISL
ncbi:cytochrome c biogenesis protein CcdA [Halobacterium salinarum]|uniref:cytochrome c biogenesis protein CcdA n=1 Tax=Halobacterium salinarum TaxID=2242 RepID=UPI002555C5F5|nr:cytochrome c biogenesis protein CcdA [Halobacterium salinarum]MDL0136432.1 cytochrome c biogenesis protein CcdA [Halobacterium salinarum]